MSLGWFTLGSSGDVKITSLNVGEGTLITNRTTRRVGISVDPNENLISTLQIGSPIGQFPPEVVDEGSMSLLIVADKGYRPTSFNQVGGGTLGFSNSLDSTIWVNTNDIVPVGQGTGISFGGRTPNGHVPFARLTGFRADDTLDRGGFSLEVLDTLPINPDQFGDLSGKPVLFERMRITGEGKVGFGGVSDPQFGVEIREDLGCNGLFNGGYERYEPTYYNVSGSTITDLNSVNVFGNLAQQTDTWYYSFENKSGAISSDTSLPPQSKVASRCNCITFDGSGNVYTAGVVEISPNAQNLTGAFREGEVLLNPEIIFPPSISSIVTKSSPSGDIIWSIRFFTFIDRPGFETFEWRRVSISSIAVSRNSNSVAGAERFDIYVLGITTGDILLISPSQVNSWGANSQVVFSDWGINNCFLARFESVYIGTTETGIELKELISIEGPNIFPMGLDTFSPQTFVETTIRSESRVGFAVATYRRSNPTMNRDLRIKYTNTFPAFFQNLPSIATHDIPLNQFYLSVFRIGGSGGNYLNGANLSSYYINSNIVDNSPTPNIQLFSITNSRAPFSREGTLRMGHDITKKSVYFTIPVGSGGVIYRTPVNTQGTLLRTFSRPGSIIIKTSGNMAVADYTIPLISNVNANSLCITRSIDVDRGRVVNNVYEESVYVAGSFREGFSVNTSDIITPPGTPQNMSAFLLKIRDNGSVEWTVVVDGDNEDEGISVAVQDDILQDNSGKYNVYLSGTFRGNGISPYVADVYDATNNPFAVTNNPSVVISQSEIGPPGGHEESFLLKFNYDGKYLFNYKATGTEDVAIKYIDAGPGGNVAMCGLMNTSLMRIQEPDGAISRYIPMEKYQKGFAIKFRTAGTLILPTPSGGNSTNIYKKTIVNTSLSPLYVAVYNPQSLLKSIPSVSVIPGAKTMDFIYDSETWVPEASDKLTTDLLFLDRDNGRFGFGTTFPRATVDVRGDMEVSGSATIGRDLRVNGNMVVGGNIDIDGTVNVISTVPNPYLQNNKPIIPSGAIVMWAGEVPPNGWVLCDGSTHNQVTTPDLRGRFVLGHNPIATANIVVPNNGNSLFRTVSTTYQVPAFPIGDVSGESRHTLTISEMPTHTHTIPFRGSGTFSTANNNNGGSSEVNQFPSQADINAGRGDVTSNTGQDEPHNNMPPYYVLAFIMKL